MTDYSLGPNAHLVGVPGSRSLLDTPALCIDRDALDRNIAAMAAHAAAIGLGLRPHAKTHKSVRVAKLQQEAGAIGISCATLGEAEVMVRGGIKGVLVTSPVVTPVKIARLAALNGCAHDGLMVVVDHPRNLADLDAAAQKWGKQLDVLIDCAAGYHRTGVADEASLLALARQAMAAEGLRLRGIQHYSGNVQHIAGREERRRVALERLDRLAALVARARDIGASIEIVTGAGTGTFDLDPEAHVFTELQCGSYVFMDVEYQQVMADGRNGPPFETALFVQTAVVSVNAAPMGFVSVDGGLKCFATDGPQPELLSGAPAGSRYERFGDEHGKLVLAPGAAPPDLGDRVEWMTPHCDPTVNLHDVYHVLRGDTLEEIWPVNARGKR
ncbi:MAG TPA: DSD1 family PLP-dependent enzyme [Stellaceae bacterium]|jgi:D-serine deaminase-like pyridoxal phosphate-dependent protein